MNYTELFQLNNIFIETEHYILRRIQSEDTPFYEKLAQQDISSFLHDAAGITALAWEDLLSEEHLTCSIIKRVSGAFCGFCQLQWIDSPTPELGIDLLTEYQNQGVALEILPPFLLQAKMRLKNHYFYSKIKKNNLASQKLAEKIGGVCVGEKNLLPAGIPPELAAFAEKEFPDFFYLEYHFYP